MFRYLLSTLTLFRHWIQLRNWKLECYTIIPRCRMVRNELYSTHKLMSFTRSDTSRCSTKNIVLVCQTKKKEIIIIKWYGPYALTFSNRLADIHVDIHIMMKFRISFKYTHCLLLDCALKKCYLPFDWLTGRKKIKLIIKVFAHRFPNTLFTPSKKKLSDTLEPRRPQLCIYYYYLCSF